MSLRAAGRVDISLNACFERYLVFPNNIDQYSWQLDNHLLFDSKHVN